MIKELYFLISIIVDNRQMVNKLGSYPVVDVGR